jgi:hypothetical protein
MEGTVAHSSVKTEAIQRKVHIDSQFPRRLKIRLSFVCDCWMLKFGTSGLVPLLSTPSTQTEREPTAISLSKYNILFTVVKSKHFWQNLCLLNIFFPLAPQPTFFFLGGGPWPTSMKLSVSLQFTRSWTFGRTPWTGDQMVARPLPVHKHRKTHIHKH